MFLYYHEHGAVVYLSPAAGNTSSIYSCLSKALLKTTVAILGNDFMVWIVVWTSSFSRATNIATSINNCDRKIARKIVASMFEIDARVATGCKSTY